MVARRKLLADNGQLRSPDHWNTEADLPNGKKFYAIKADKIRAYGWFSSKHKGVFYISHFAFKQGQKLATTDASGRRELATNRGASVMTNFLDRWAGESDANAKLVAEELLIAEVTEAIWEAMEDGNTSKTELAQRMGASKGHVSQVLSGSRNMTLRTLADICHALNLKPAFSLQTIAHPQCYRTEPGVPELQKSSKLRYTKLGNTIYLRDVWTEAA